MPSALQRAAEAVLPALAQAARSTGADFNALFQTARLESGFNPAARAGTSSATGLFQFIESTWLDTVARHGPRHGIAPASRAEALALRTNPAVAALMAAEHMGENAARLERATGRPPSSTDLYLAHFLGAGGAARFLTTLDRAPDTPGVQLFPRAAGANRGIFFDRAGAPRSLADIRDLFARRMGLAPDQATTRPPALAAAIARPAPGTSAPAPGTSAPAPGTSAPAPAAHRLAAQAAYLLLADLGA